MRLKHIFVTLVLAGHLSGCDAYLASRADRLPLSEVKFDGRQALVPSAVTDARFNVTSVQIDVPETLKVSEANYLYPEADVVWRGEPQGDRLAQVKSILTDSATLAAPDLTSGPDAIVSLRLERFHALTERARFSVGGVHNIVFVMVVRDAGTGAIVEGPRRVEIAIRASGGDRAIAEDIAGRTQRVVIVESLAEAIRRELSGIAPSSEHRKPRLFGGFN